MNGGTTYRFCFDAIRAPRTCGLCFPDLAIIEKALIVIRVSERDSTLSDIGGFFDAFS